MNNLKKWVSGLFPPSQIQELNLEDLQKALQNHEVQTVWFQSMIDKLQDANIAIDGLLDKQDKDRLWETVAIERRTILRCLNMIVEAQQRIDNERFEQATQDRLFAQYQGVAAPLDSRR